MPEKINTLNLLSDILLELNNNNLYLGYSLEYGHKNPLYDMICFGPGKTSNFEIVEQDGGGEGGSEGEEEGGAEGEKVSSKICCRGFSSSLVSFSCPALDDHEVF